MNGRAALLGLSMIAVALAGCSGGGDSGPSAQEQCEMNDMLWNTGVCEPHTEPSVILTGLNGTLAAYSTYLFTYALDNGTRGGEQQVHSMDSRVMAQTDGSVPTNMSVPDDFGTEIARAEHQNLPVEFEGEFSWPTANEDVTLWGYMLIDGVNVWNQIKTVSIIEVVPTGTTETITFSANPGPVADRTNIQITVGDEVVFANGMPVPMAMSYTVTFDCNNGLSFDSLTIDAGASSDAIMVTDPTTCNWTANSQASQTGNDPFVITGKFSAFAP